MDNHPYIFQTSLHQNSHAPQEPEYEPVTTFTNAEGKEHIYSVEPMEVIKKEGNLYTFQVKHSLSNSGSFKVAYRMFPKNVDLPHRQDFCYVRWFN